MYFIAFRWRSIRGPKISQKISGRMLDPPRQRTKYALIIVTIAMMILLNNRQGPKENAEEYEALMAHCRCQDLTGEK